MIEAVRHVVEGDVVIREGKDGGEWKKLDQADAGQLLVHLPTAVSTEIMPPGVRLFREAGGVAQIVQEVPPRVARVVWGPSEYGLKGGRGTHYLVAQPWVVVLSTWQEGVLVGARMFYRPDPIYTLDDQLFHTNLPNINCLGYNTTAVGWICFYADKINTQKMTWGQRMGRMLERAGGGEAYSEGNMHGIDGPAIYRRHQPGKTWKSSPGLWEQQTKKYGVSRLWAAKSALVPVKVKGLDSQLKHDEKGKPLTIRMAIDGGAPWYYSLPQVPHPPAKIARGQNIEVGAASFGKAYALACKRKKV